MEEMKRTLIYVGLALVVCLGAGVSAYQPTNSTDTASASGEVQLFDVNPLDVDSLEITKYDADLGSLETFEVAKKNGRWVLPSHSGYPADAENQIRDSIAGAGLHNLESVGLHTEEEREHAECGVIQPSESTTVGSEGVGTLITMKDSGGEELVKLIVGHKVEGTTDLRFVRKPGQARVYVAKVDLEKLPTQFDKWIEKDLLKITGFDIAAFLLKDYSILPTADGRFGLDRRMEAAIRWDSEGNKWELDKLTLFRGAREIDGELGEQEELNKQRLDDLKFAVDDMKIVDVSPKPAGMGNKLKAEASLLKDREAQASLLSKGFIPVPQSNNDVEIMGSNGEVHIDMKDGVQYILRFGKIQGEEKGSAEGKLNRYLFVTTRFNEDLLPKPQLEEEPAAPADVPAADAKEDAKGDEGKQADEDEQEEAEDDAADKKPDAKKEESKEGEKKGEEKTPVFDPKKAERERIKKENQRKLDEYQDKRKKAENKVRELNARFADWYYVISEDTYKKIHLGRADIVQEGAKAKEEGFGIDAFRELEKSGPAKAAAQPPATPNFQPRFPGQ
jgi:hypothetical protein